MLKSYRNEQAQTPGAPPQQSEIGAETRPRANLARALRLTLRQGWDRLGLLMAISLTWFALLSLPLGVGRLLPNSISPLLRLAAMLLVGVVTLSAPFAAANHVAHRIAAFDEVSYLDYWRSVRSLATPATVLGSIQMLVVALFGANFWFYLQLHGLAGTVASFLCLYVALAWGMMSLLHYPLLAAQEAGVFDEPGRRARRGAPAAIRRAFFLALGRPFYALGLLLIAIFVTALCMLTAVPFALFWAGGLALLATQATRQLLIQYEILPAPPADEPIPDEQFRLK